MYMYKPYINPVLFMIAVSGSGGGHQEGHAARPALDRNHNRRVPGRVDRRHGDQQPPLTSSGNPAAAPCAPVLPLAQRKNPY